MEKKFERRDASQGSFFKDRNDSASREARPDGERRSFSHKPGGSERKSFNPNFTSDNKLRREGGFNREGGDFKPRTEGGFNREKRDFKPRTEGGFNREKRDFKPRTEGGFNRERGDFKPSTEGGFNRERGDFKPRTEGGFNRERGDFKPRTEGGFNRERGDFKPRTEGGFNRERGDFKPRTEGGFNREKRDFKPRTEGGFNRERGDFKPRTEGGFNRERGDFKPRTEGGFNRERGDFKPRTEGGFNRERGDFKPRTEGGFNRERGDFKPRTEGGFNSDKPRRPRISTTFQSERKFGKPIPKRDFSAKPTDIEGVNTYTPDPIINREIRLNRYVAMSGICSRREADNFISEGLISVNGAVVTELGTKIKNSDTICYNGEVIRGEKKVYIVMNKPKGFVTTVEDDFADRTVIDLLKGQVQERVYPIGRLDKNTMGVLLLTNDGDLTKVLTHPSYKKKKIYHVFLDKNLSEEDMEHIAQGVELEDGVAYADEISLIGEGRKEIGIEVHAGRNRIVRRLFEHFGYKITKLDRVYFAGITKKGLQRGIWRHLTPKEVQSLKSGMYK